LVERSSEVRVSIAVLVLAIAGSNVAAAQTILLLCTGKFFFTTYGPADVTRQTVEINLAARTIRGLGRAVTVDYVDERKIDFSGTTPDGVPGGGSIDRVSGDLIFGTPWPMTGPKQLSYMLRCSPAQPRF
jgi:hypothetical protein